MITVCAGNRLRLTVCVIPLSPAVITAVWFVFTEPAVAANVATEAFPGTVVLPGTVSAGLLLVKVTTRPLAGAGLVSVTEQLATAPLFRLDTVQVNELSTVCPPSASAVLCELPL